MTPEERELLTKSIELSEENNKMLRSMRRSARLSSILRAVYWLIILGLAFGSYYVIKPYIDPIINGYTEIQSNFNDIKNTTSMLQSLPSWLGGNK